MEKSVIILVIVIAVSGFIGFVLGSNGSDHSSSGAFAQVYAPDVSTLVDATASPAVQWNQIVLATIASEQISPPEASRYLAMMHRAMRLALWQKKEDMNSAHLIDFVGERMYHEFFPDYANITLQRDFDRTLFYEEESFAVGIVNNQLDEREVDRAAAYKSHTIKNEIGMWRATPPYFLEPLLPQWGDVTLFAAAPEDIELDPPPKIDGELYAEEFEEVREWGGVVSDRRTPEHDEIAKYWADGKGTHTPPGHWNLIAQNVLMQEVRTLEEEVEIFAVLNTALADAGIGAWYSKFLYEYWRPIDAIRNADQDGNDATDVDAQWFNYIEAPNFPEYPSGHSAFSAAGAEVLTHFFGSRQSFTSHSLGLPGVSRSFSSFEAAAEEAGMSRIYGGIHFQSANIHGLALGRTVARKAISE